MLVSVFDVATNKLNHALLGFLRDIGIDALKTWNWYILICRRIIIGV